ncbi:hypothetical protein ACNF40_04700 [Cuniculiplasma sp. SKW4]
MNRDKILQEAEDLISGKKYEEAFGYLDAAILKHPKEVSFLELYAQTLFKLGILQNAEEYAERAIKYGTKSPSIYRIKATCLFNNNKFGEISEYVEEGLRIAQKDDSEMSKLFILSSASKVYENKNNWYDEAYALISRAIKSDPYNRDALLVSLFINSIKGNLENVRDVEKIISGNRNNNLNVLYFIINAYMGTGDLNTSYNLINDLLKKGGNEEVSDYSIFMLYYEILKKRGDTSEFFPLLTEFLIGSSDERRMNFFLSLLHLENYKVPVLYTGDWIPLLTELMDREDHQIPGEIMDYVLKSDYLDACIKSKNGDSVLFMFRAISTFLEGDPDEGVAYIDKSIEIKENWLNGLIKAVLLMNTSEASYETAEKADIILQKWEKIEPNRASIHQLRAIIQNFALGQDGREEMDEARKIEPYLYPMVITDIMIRIAHRQFLQAIQIIDDYNDRGFIHSIEVFYQISMLKAYCLEDIPKASEMMMEITKSLKSSDSYENWEGMIMNRKKFIPQELYVENLPVPLFYPFLNPNPDELIDAVRSAFILRVLNVK